MEKSQIVLLFLEKIEAPTMEPIPRSPKKTRWVSQETERFIKWAKGYGGRICNACHYEFPNSGKLLEHVSQHKVSYLCACGSHSNWRSSIRNHKNGHGGAEHQVIYTVDAEIFEMWREHVKYPLKDFPVCEPFGSLTHRRHRDLLHNQ